MPPEREGNEGGSPAGCPHDVPSSGPTRAGTRPVPAGDLADEDRALGEPGIEPPRGADLESRCRPLPPFCLQKEREVRCVCWGRLCTAQPRPSALPCSLHAAPAPARHTTLPLHFFFPVSGLFASSVLVAGLRAPLALTTPSPMPAALPGGGCTLQRCLVSVGRGGRAGPRGTWQGFKAHLLSDLLSLSFPTFRKRETDPCLT